MVIKRWWGIRHVRYYIAAYQFNQWWNNFGRTFWLAPNDKDIQHLRDIWEGRA